MGDLIKMSNSDLQATIQVLDQYGVAPHDFEVLRKASSWSQETIARVHKTDPSVWAALEFEDAAVRAGFLPAEIRVLAQRKDLLGLIREAIRGQAPQEPESLWKKVSETAINVNLSFSPKLPFDGAEVKAHVGVGWAPVEKRLDGLYVDGRKVVLHLSKRQQQGSKLIKGYELRDELSGKPVLNANILDALYENPHLIPEDWKKDDQGNIRFIYFWGTIYRSPADDRLCVRCLYFRGGAWAWGYRWLGYDWRSDRPAALLASS